MSDVFTIGGALKRKGIKQREVVKTLNKKYKLSISESGFHNYSRQYICGNTLTWLVIKECLENEYGIIYKPTYWN